MPNKVDTLLFTTSWNGVDISSLKPMLGFGIRNKTRCLCLSSVKFGKNPYLVVYLKKIKIILLCFDIGRLGEDSATEANLW